MKVTAEKQNDKDICNSYLIFSMFVKVEQHQIALKGGLRKGTGGQFEIWEMSVVENSKQPLADVEECDTASSISL